MKLSTCFALILLSLPTLCFADLATQMKNLRGTWELSGSFKPSIIIRKQTENSIKVLMKKASCSYEFDSTHELVGCEDVLFIAKYSISRDAFCAHIKYVEKYTTFPGYTFDNTDTVTGPVCFQASIENQNQMIETSDLTLEHETSAGSGNRYYYPLGETVSEFEKTQK